MASTLGAWTWILLVLDWFVVGFYFYHFGVTLEREEEEEKAQRAAITATIMLLDQVSFRRQRRHVPDDDCSVCLGPVEIGEMCCVLPTCRHEFHRECLETWFKTNNSTCPVCRANMQLPHEEMV